MVKFEVKIGFTIAEVLITLTIIGIVASLTIPTLINDYQKKQYVIALKKTYSQWNQALQQIAVDNGCVGDLACTKLFSTGKTTQTLGDEIVKYFKIAKNCKTRQTTNQDDCWAKDTLSNYDGSYGATSHTNYNSYDNYKFLTLDNVSVSLSNSFAQIPALSDCKSGSNGRHITGHMDQACAFISFDINGPKKPNIEGRDTFSFWITNGKGPLLYPVNGYDTNQYWKEGSPPLPWEPEGESTPYCSEQDKMGSRCTARIIEEGWEMNY